MKQIEARGSLPRTTCNHFHSKYILSRVTGLLLNNHPTPTVSCTDGIKLKDRYAELKDNRAVHLCEGDVVAALCIPCQGSAGIPVCPIVANGLTEKFVETSIHFLGVSPTNHCVDTTQKQEGRITRDGICCCINYLPTDVPTGSMLVMTVQPTFEESGLPIVYRTCTPADEVKFCLAPVEYLLDRIGVHIPNLYDLLNFFYVPWGPEDICPPPSGHSHAMSLFLLSIGVHFHAISDSEARNYFVARGGVPLRVRAECRSYYSPVAELELKDLDTLTGELGDPIVALESRDTAAKTNSAFYWSAVLISKHMEHLLERGDVIDRQRPVPAEDLQLITNLATRLCGFQSKYAIAMDIGEVPTSSTPEAVKMMTMKRLITAPRDQAQVGLVEQLAENQLDAKSKGISSRIVAKAIGPARTTPAGKTMDVLLWI